MQTYNFASKQWATFQKPIQLPTMRFDVAAVAAGDGRIYVIGGADPTSGSAVATVEAYTPKTNNWATVASLTSAGAYISAAAGPDGRIYALGGITSNGSMYALRGVVEAYGPVLSLVSSHGSAGSTQALMGSNFAANATVSILFGPMNTVVATAQTDSNGAVSGTLTYQVPSVAPGTYRVTAVDNKSAYPVYASFTVQ